MKCDKCGSELFVMIQCKESGHAWYAGELDEFVKNHAGAFAQFKPVEFKQLIRPHGTTIDERPIEAMKHWQV